MPDTLVPGAGNWAAFDAIVAGLGTIGSGKYDDAKAAARWANVPYDVVTGTVTVGVIPAHGCGLVFLTNFGIDHVDFYLEGGDPVVVTAPTYNATLQLWGFWAVFDADSVSDGVAEIRAIIYPLRGLCRVLSGAYDSSTASISRGETSLFLNANHDGSLPVTTYYVDSVNGDDGDDGSTSTPVQTLSQARVLLRTGSQMNGAVVKLRAGNYGWPNQAGNPYKNYDRWVIIEPDAGVDRADVVINSVDGLNYAGMGCRYTKLVNITIYDVQLTQAGDVPDQNGDYTALWFKACDIYASVKTNYAGAKYQDWRRGTFYEDTLIHFCNTAVDENTRHMLNCTLYDLGVDALRNVQGLCANVTIHTQRQIAPDHADVIQFIVGRGDDDEFENTIFYGVHAYDIGITDESPDGILIRALFAVPSHKDLAFINCNMAYPANGHHLHKIDHLIVWHCSFMPNYAINPASPVGGTWRIADDPPDSPETVIHNPSLVNNVFYFLSVTRTLGNENLEPEVSDGTWAKNNHYVTLGDSPGTDVTTGESMDDLFVDPQTENFTPLGDSVLALRRTDTLVPGDVNGAERFNLGAIGAVELSTVPDPNLTNITIRSQYGKTIHAAAPNAGGDVTGVDSFDPNDWPKDMNFIVENGTVVMDGLFKNDA